MYRIDYFEEVFPEFWKIGSKNDWGYKIGAKYEVIRGIPTGCRRNASDILRKLYKNKAEKAASTVKEWFDEIDKWCKQPDESLPQELKKDLFFGFIFMYGEQVMLRYGQLLEKELCEVFETKEYEWYKKLKELLWQIPDCYSFESQGIIMAVERIIVEKFARRGGTGIAIAEEQSERIRKYRQRRGQIIPNINKDIIKNLKNDLATAKLKHSRERPDGMSYANNKKAAELLLELAGFFGVKMESLGRVKDA